MRWNIWCLRLSLVGAVTHWHLKDRFPFVTGLLHWPIWGYIFGIQSSHLRQWKSCGRVEGRHSPAHPSWAEVFVNRVKQRALLPEGFHCPRFWNYTFSLGRMARSWLLFIFILRINWPKTRYKNLKHRYLYLKDIDFTISRPLKCQTNDS